MKKATISEELIEIATVTGKLIKNWPVAPDSINTNGRKAIIMARVEVKSGIENSVALRQAASKRDKP